MTERRYGATANEQIAQLAQIQDQVSSAMAVKGS